MKLLSGEKHPMHLSSNIVYLHYSDLLSVHVVRVILYSLEIFLFKSSITNHLFMSAQNSPKQKELIKIINNNKRTIVCTSYKFGLTLTEFTQPINLDLPSFDIDDLTNNQIEDVKWTLVLVKAVTPNTKKMMKKIIPVDFPEQSFT